MNVGFLINEFETLVPTQSTAMLMKAGVELGHDVFAFGVGELSVRGGQGVVKARKVQDAGDVGEQVAALRQAASLDMTLDEFDILLIRTNPARDSRAALHTTALELLSGMEGRTQPGQIWNRPSGLLEWGSKVSLTRLPVDVFPKTLMSSQREELIEFVRGAGVPCVLKPARGSRGRGVFKMAPDSVNLGATIDVLLADGMVVAQEFVPEGARGDVRVLCLDGEILELNGCPGAIGRVPASADFRSNIHAGGTAVKTPITDEMRAVVHRIGPLLTDAGLRFVGLDFIGPVLCEVNVFSTGGLRDIERFWQQPFSNFVMERLLS